MQIKYANEINLPGELILKVDGPSERWRVRQLPGNSLVLAYQAHEPTGEHLGISITAGLQELLTFNHVCLPRPVERRLIQILDQPGTKHPVTFFFSEE